MSRLKKYWQGKNIVITGASSGLGKSLCEALVPYGVHFALLSRRESKLQELADQFKDSDCKFWIRACDVSNQQQIQQCIYDFAGHVGKIDVVWINSGVSHDSSMDNWNWEKVETMIDTNLKGAIYTAKAALDVMGEQGCGAIVGIGSASSMRGLPRRSIYSVTKIGVEYFLEGMAVDFPQLQFTTIHPGYVDTPINNKSPNRLWLIHCDKAAQLMIKAVAKRKHVYIYPWQMRLFYKFVRHLPHFLYYKLAERMKNYSRPPKEQQN
ncbi:SDR family NAD(P)-dependent oxidoreductase [Candidatus Uabimicrobium sp. HlEnr_7]|uniref:SDR family NAD(P)-dependent oxidoreductase n=1 Tax=Candidatus Uabimicrobium helgolandensis TaxID=3095367 RepID=UPI00355846D3